MDVRVSFILEFKPGSLVLLALRMVPKDGPLGEQTFLVPARPRVPGSNKNQPL